MPVYQYNALDARGNDKKGVIEGDNARHARQLLREMQLTPVQIREGTEQLKGDHGGKRRLRGSLKTADLAMLTRQTATLAASGTPLAETLQTVAQQTEKAKTRTLVLAVRSRLLEGHSLADSLALFPNAFPDLYRATVAAGEQTGKLDRVLEQLADYTEERQAIQGTVQKALVYPAFLVLVCIAIVGFLLTYAVPQVVGIFAEQGRELPQMTQVLLTLSSLASDYGLAVLIGVGALLLIFHQLLKRESIRYRYDRMLLRVPILGRLIRASNAAQFARTLAILSGSGVPLLQALQVAGEVISNLPMRRAVEETSNRVREGAGVSRSLAQSALFPPMLVHMIASGEASGELADMLARGAKQQDRELNALVSTLTALLGPVIILIMGVVVLFIVIAMILPMLQLNTFV